MSNVKPVPEGYHTVTPYLLVDGAERLIDFVRQAFGGQEVFRFAQPDGRLMHAEVQIGDSRVMLCEASDEWPAKRCMLYLYVEDVDATYRKAIAAGAAAIREPRDEFYGDRSGGVTDPSGNQWWISTHVEDVAAAELQSRMEAQPR